MGNGQIGGNSSLEWIFVHHDADGNPRNLNVGTDVVIQGTGDREGTVRVKGLDPISFADIGGRPGLIPGHFVVTLSFATADEADRAMKAMVQRASTLVILVPAVDRTNDTNPENRGRPKEIRIDW